MPLEPTSAQTAESDFGVIALKRSPVELSDRTALIHGSQGGQEH